MKPDQDARVVRGVTALLAQRRARLDAGEQALGWKIGFGAPAAMARLDIAAPLFGYLMKHALVASGAAVDLSGWTQPIAEPEIAVRLGADVAPGSNAPAAYAAIAALTPAIELADLAFAATPQNVEAVLEGNIFQRRVVLGPDSRTGGDTTGLHSRIFRRGKLAAETAEPEALTGRLPDLLVHLADFLGGFGERLKAGDIVICGSTMPPPLIDPDETSFTHVVDPIGEVSVRFTR